MNSILVAIFFIGLLFTLGGGSIVFSNKVLDWMYKEKLWEVAPPFDEKSDRKWRRLTTGWGTFLMGIVILSGLVYLTFI